MSQSLEEKQKRLDQQKAKLVQKAQKIRAQARKMATRKLIHLGQLITNAGLADLEESALLGGLQELKKRSEKESTIQEWKDQATTIPSVTPSTAVIVSFPSLPSKEIQSQLKNLGLKWNEFRQEWQGFANFDTVRKILSGTDALFEKVEQSRK